MPAASFQISRDTKDGPEKVQEKAIPALEHATKIAKEFFYSEGLLAVVDTVNEIIGALTVGRDCKKDLRMWELVTSINTWNEQQKNRDSELEKLCKLFREHNPIDLQRSFLTVVGQEEKLQIFGEEDKK